MAKLFIILIVVWIVKEVKCQCYIDSDISIYQSGYLSQQYQESNNQCLANYTVISASIIDNSVSKGITCSRKDSTANDGTWSLNGTAVNCSNTTGPVRCTRQQPGSVTLFTAGNYTKSGDDAAVPEGSYTCCIEGLCTSIRLLQFATIDSMYRFDKRFDSELESCTIIPPFDITVVPQQYFVQMVTSLFPPSRLASFIRCTGGSCGDSVGESYYTLVNLTAERYQFTVPVTWSADSTSNTEHDYSCTTRYGSLSDSGKGDYLQEKAKKVAAFSSNAPSSLNYDAVNVTDVKISWNITGNVTGFVINITSSGLDTVTEQLTDSSVRELVINGLLPERDYTVEVRGYYQLLGPAIATTVRLEGIILDVEITTEPNNLGTLIEGTYIDLVCNTSINNNVTIAAQWSRNGVTITNGSDYSISVVELVSGNYISTVGIEELETSDNNATFTCSMTATPLVSTYITGSNSIQISVREFQTTDITVAIAIPSVPTAGDQLNVTCIATVPERLVSSYSPDTFAISYDSGGNNIVVEDNPDATQSDVSQDGNVFSRVISINPVKTSDARRYYCIVAFATPLDTSPVSANEDLEVHIPPPSMSVSLSHSGIIYKSTPLVITCNASVPSVVDTDVSATVTWTGPNGIVNTDERITVGQVVSVDDNVFESTLTFQPVDTDTRVNYAGQYTCQAIVSSTDILVFNGTSSISTKEILLTGGCPNDYSLPCKQARIKAICDVVKLRVADLPKRCVRGF